MNWCDQYLQKMKKLAKDIDSNRNSWIGGRPINNIKSRPPDESGIYIFDKTKNVNIWANYKSRGHGSHDDYEVYIETTEGKFIDRFTIYCSQIPSYIVGGKSYYKGK